MNISDIQKQIQQWISSHNPSVQLQYQVPLLGEGGTCSLFGELDDVPFKLQDVLSEQHLELLNQVQSVVDWVQTHLNVDWFGVYLKRVSNDQSAVLTKLAYYGAPSRAEFPLTPEFAELSNNTSVGLSGEKRLINSVAEYRQQGGEYYTCDPKVNSELCWPIISPNISSAKQQGSEILGIIDAECFNENKFDLHV